MGTKRTTKRTRKRASSRHLPIDIVGNILSRLPSKSVVRFRCVCKPWRDLISDPKFIELHRNQNNNGHILVQYVLPDPEPEFRPDSHLEYSISLHCEETFEEHTLVELPSRRFEVLGYSNGLVCLSDSISGIYLCNPSIWKVKLLPDSPFHSDRYSITRAAFALAFVPQVNDYKVLKIVYNIDDGLVLETKIYSLSTNSWKMVETEARCQVENYSFTRVLNGVAHFMAKDVDDNAIILSFDMADEVFGKIMIPKTFNPSYIPHAMNAIMFEKLLFVIRPYYKNGSYPCDFVDIWAMNENGGAVESWTQKLWFDGEYIVPVGFLKNGDLVWRENGPDELYSYDIILSKIYDLEFDDGLKFDGGAGLVTVFTHYMESLVLLND